MYRDDISKWKGNVEIAGYGLFRFILSFTANTLDAHLRLRLRRLRRRSASRLASRRSLFISFLPFFSSYPPMGILFTRRRVHDEKRKVRTERILERADRSIGYRRKILRIDGAAMARWSCLCYRIDIRTIIRERGITRVIAFLFSSLPFTSLLECNFRRLRIDDEDSRANDFEWRR